MAPEATVRSARNSRTPPRHRGAGNGHSSSGVSPSVAAANARLSEQLFRCATAVKKGEHDSAMIKQTIQALTYFLEGTSETTTISKKGNHGFDAVFNKVVGVVTGEVPMKSMSSRQATSQKNAGRAAALLEEVIGEKDNDHSSETSRSKGTADDEEHFTERQKRNNRDNAGSRNATSANADPHRNKVNSTDKPCFQRPVNPKSPLIANGWIEQQRRSKMRVVWKDVLASLVEGRKPHEETTLWIQREVTKEDGRTELEALHQIPVKWLEQVTWSEYSMDNRFALKVYNLTDEFVFRCESSSDAAQNWVLTLRSAKEIARGKAKLSENSNSSIGHTRDGSSPTPFVGHTRDGSSPTPFVGEAANFPPPAGNQPYHRRTASTNSEVGAQHHAQSRSFREEKKAGEQQRATATTTGSQQQQNVRLPIKELRALAHGAGINTSGMERSELERVVKNLGANTSSATAAPPPPAAAPRPPRTVSPVVPQRSTTPEGPEDEEQHIQRESEAQRRLQRKKELDRRLREKEEAEKAAAAARREELERNEKIKKQKEEEEQRRRMEVNRLRELQEAERRNREEEERKRLEEERIRRDEEAILRRAQEQKAAEARRKQEEAAVRQQEAWKKQQAAWQQQKQEHEARQRAEQAEAARRQQEEAHRRQQQAAWQQQQSRVPPQPQQWQQQQQRPPQTGYPRPQQQSQRQPPHPQHQQPFYGAPPPQPQQPAAGTVPPQPNPASAASMKYAKMASQNEQANTATAVTPQAIKHGILVKWALQPPAFQVLRPIEILITSIHTVFPPSFGVPGHAYFTKYTPLTQQSIVDTTTMRADNDKLKKAVRKLRFFLHPDKLPQDLTPEQEIVCKMLWDITSDAFEEHKKKEEDLGWMR